MFQLTKEDCLRCQIGTLNGKRGEHLKYLPYAFTENGIAMLSGVLKSPTAIDVNIRIMRAFTAMRRFVFDHAGLVQRVGAIEMKQLETDKRIDNAELHNLGSSINSLGRRVTTFTTRDPTEIAKLRALLP